MWFPASETLPINVRCPCHQDLNHCNVLLDFGSQDTVKGNVEGWVQGELCQSFIVCCADRSVLSSIISHSSLSLSLSLSSSSSYNSVPQITTLTISIHGTILHPNLLDVRKKAESRSLNPCTPELDFFPPFEGFSFGTVITYQCVKTQGSPKESYLA